MAERIKRSLVYHYTFIQNSPVTSSAFASKYDIQTQTVELDL